MSGREQLYPDREATFDAFARHVFEKLDFIFYAAAPMPISLWQRLDRVAAKAVGANAVLNIRFATSSVAAGAAELFVYGTAVVLE